jgi:hypothetical protein
MHNRLDEKDIEEKRCVRGWLRGM